MTEPAAAPTPRLIGLVTDDARTYAANRRAELVAFEAERGPRMTTREWLRTVAAIEGRTGQEASALADAVLARAGLGPGAPQTIGALHAQQLAALALAETAVIIAKEPAAFVVVVPQPPIPWPYRNEIRRLAASMLAGAEVVLHAYAAWELLPLVEHDFIVNASGGAIAAPPGHRTVMARVYGTGAPYEAWRAALEATGVLVAGGPIAHVLAVPEGMGPREVLAAAHDAGLDVLEVREAFDEV